MSTDALSESVLEPKSRKLRKTKRIGPDGKSMHRIVLTLTETDYNYVVNAITTRTGSLFVKSFGGTKVVATGPNDEYRGRAITEICKEWQKDIDEST
jgi:hypothetical protein